MAVYLIRHANAGVRGTVCADDLERPLDKRGIAQAKALAEAFEPVDLDAIHASRALRCLQTVGGIAASHGLEIIGEDALTEGTSMAEATELCRRSVGGKNAALCSHGDVIPAIISQLMRDGMTVSGARGCEKGSIWLLETRGRDIVRGRYFADAAAFLSENRLAENA